MQIVDVRYKALLSIENKSNVQHEPSQTPRQITYGWLNGDRRSLKTNPGTNTTVRRSANKTTIHTDIQ